MWEPEHRRVADRHGLRCPSDLTDAEWALAEPLIPLVKHGGRKRTVNVREVLKAMCYILSRIKVVLIRGYMMRRDVVKTTRGAAQSFPAIVDAGGAIEVHFMGQLLPNPVRRWYREGDPLRPQCQRAERDIQHCCQWYVATGASLVGTH